MSYEIKIEGYPQDVLQLMQQLELRGEASLTTIEDSDLKISAIADIGLIMKILKILPKLKVKVVIDTQG